MKNWDIVAQFDPPISTARVPTPARRVPRMTMTGHVPGHTWITAIANRSILQIHEISRVLSVAGVPWDEIPDRYKRYSVVYRRATIVIAESYTIDNFTLILV